MTHIDQISMPKKQTTPTANPNETGHSFDPPLQSFEQPITNPPNGSINLYIIHQMNIG